MTLNIEQTLALLRQPRETVICGHVNPDGDAIGSGLALAELLRAMGHRVTSLLAKGDKPPELYSFFKGYSFTPANEYQGDPELFIVVDSPNKQRLGDGAAVFDRAADNLVIDHHPDYDGFARHYCGNPAASATGLLIWQLIKASKLAITPQMAEYCYVALMTDTGRFAFQNTSAESFIAAGEMIAAGADATDASMQVYDSKSLDALRLDARLISRISYAAGGRVVYSWVTEADFAELDVVRDETEGLPTILRSVKGTEIAILLREESGRVRVNLRAKGGCDVGEFARRFGGGGHKSAAGFTIDKTLEEAQALILGKADCLFC